MALPLYPELKIKLEEWFVSIMRTAVERQLGPFNQSQLFIQHEGETHQYSTVDGDERELVYQTFSVTFEPSVTEFANMPLERLLRLLVEKGTELGQQQAKYHFGQIDKITEETGNIVRSSGEPISLDMLLKLFEKLYVDFDEHGVPRLPTIVASPELAEQARDVLREAESDPDGRARLAEILEQKRREWDEAESRRKLVD